MKLAISNIAWEAKDDELVAALMREHGVDGVEIAPTVHWPSPLEASAKMPRPLSRCNIRSTAT